MSLHRTAFIALATIALLTSGAVRAEEPEPAPVSAAVDEDRSDWPEPTADDAPHTFILVDLLEYQESREAGKVRWDAYGWYGGDEKRIWVKTEGTQTARGGGGEVEAQILYGKLISPFFDAQAGVRFRHRSGPGPNTLRTYASIGLQGLAPYRYELEPTVFISDRGQVSARVTASYDQLLSQRLILQPRFEFNIATKSDRQFGVGSGLNDTELGVRLRYELKREFAPYIGVTWKQSYGETRRLERAEGNATSLVSVVVGVRAWF